MRSCLLLLVAAGLIAGATGCVKRTSARSLRISEMGNPSNQSTDEQGRRLTKETLWIWDKEFWK